METPGRGSGFQVAPQKGRFRVIVEKTTQATKPEWQDRVIYSAHGERERRPVLKGRRNRAPAPGLSKGGMRGHSDGRRKNGDLKLILPEGFQNLFGAHQKDFHLLQIA